MLCAIHMLKLGNIFEQSIFPRQFIRAREMIDSLVVSHTGESVRTWVRSSPQKVVIIAILRNFAQSVSSEK